MKECSYSQTQDVGETGKLPNMQELLQIFSSDFVSFSPSKKSSQSSARTNQQDPMGGPNTATFAADYLEKIGNSFPGTFNYTHVWAENGNNYFN